MNTTPRWYCSFCKRDVKFADIGTAIDAVRRCPVCHNNSVVFLQFTPRQKHHQRKPAIFSEPFLKPQPTAAEIIGAQIFKTP